MNEFDTVAWLTTDGYSRQVPVNVIFELDGNKPLGLWVEDEHGVDITELIEPEEYDVLYLKAIRHAAECAMEAAEIAAEGER